MRIGYDAKRVFHNLRGLGSYSRTTIESLLAVAPMHSYFLYTPHSSQKDLYKGFSCYPQVTIKHPKTLFDRCFHSYWRSHRMSAQVFSDKIDVFHGLSHDLPFGLKGKIRTIVTIHDLLPWVHPEIFSLFDRNLYKRKIAYSVKAADIVVTISAKTKEDLIQILGVPEAKIKVLYQSVHSRFYEKLDDKQRKAILHKYGQREGFLLAVGALEERKNLPFLIEEYTTLINQPPLVIIGRGSDFYVRKLQNLIVEKGLSSSVFLLQDVANEEIPAFYQSAVLFCQSSFFEGFGLPIVESLVSGTPVISSNTPACKEVGGESSFYFSLHKKGSLAEKMQILLSSSSQRKTMVAAGMQYAKKFSSQAIAEKLLEIYSE